MADEKKVVLLEIDINTDAAIEANKVLVGNIIGLEKEVRKLAETEGTLSDSYIKTNAELKNAKSELSANERMIRKTIEANNAAAGSIDQMSAQLSVANAKWKALSEEERTNGEVGKALSAEKKKLQEAINAEKLAVSDTTSNIGNYEAATVPLKAQLKEIMMLMQQMAVAGQDDSEEFVELAKKAGTLKDAMNATNDQIKTFTSGDALEQNLKIAKASFDAVSGAAQGVEGAMQLVGSENEDVARGIQKMVALQSIQNGVTQVYEALQKESAFMAGVLAVKTEIVTAAQWLWNAAMTANPIGAIAAGVGALIGIFGAFSLAVGGSTEELEDQKKAVIDLEKEYSDLQDRISLESKINEAIGGSVEEKSMRSRNAIREQINALELLNEALLAQRALEGDEDGELQTRVKENNDKIIALGDELIVNKLTQAKRGIDLQKAEEDKEAEERKKRAEELSKKLIEESKKRDEEVKKIRDENNISELEDLQGNEDAKAEIIAATAKRKDELAAEMGMAELERQNAANELNDELNVAEIEKLTFQYEEKKRLLQEFGYSTVELEKQFADAKIEIANKERMAKLQAFGAVGNALSSLGDIAGKETAEGKAMAIAGATINAYSGIAATLGAPTVIPEPFGSAAKIAQSVVIGATAFKAVKDIIKVKVPGGSGGGGGSISSGGGATTSVPRSSVNPEIGKGIVSRSTSTGTQSSVASGVQQGMSGVVVQPTLIIDTVTAKQNQATNNAQTATY